MMNIKRHLRNSRTRSQVNPYSLFQREKKNLKWKQIPQDMLLRECYPKNKKENKNLLHFYQGQCSEPKETMRYIIKNYLL